jgi:CHAT domain-containing protein
LLERYQFTYLTSGRELAGRQRTSLRPEIELLLIANPTYEKSISPAPGQAAAVRSSQFRGTFDPLPGTEREAKEIPPLVGGQTDQKRVFVGGVATEGSVKTARSPRILHLATHGFFLEDEMIVLGQKGRNITESYENPLVRSGLAFAGANRASTIVEGDDGILTALEITAMNLSGTDLVVLSACDTGVGEVRTGEGVFGLRRAFALAGAKNVLMSLWPVSDEITANQMRAFYNNLRKLPPAEALRQAQLETLRQLKAVYGSTVPPGLWAPFILQGVLAPGS